MTVLPGVGAITVGTTTTTSTTLTFQNGMVVGVDPATPKEKPMTLDEIAMRLDELSLDYDWPELVSLSEEIGKISDRQDAQIQRLETANRGLEEELYKYRRDDPRNRGRQAAMDDYERYKRETMMYGYNNAHVYINPPTPSVVRGII